MSTTFGGCQFGSKYVRIDGVQDWINDTIANPPDPSATVNICDNVADFPDIFNLEYNYCYPDSMSEDIFSFSDLYSIPGEGPVMYMEFAASW